MCYWVYWKDSWDNSAGYWTVWCTKWSHNTIWISQIPQYRQGYGSNNKQTDAAKFAVASSALSSSREGINFKAGF